MKKQQKATNSDQDNNSSKKPKMDEKIESKMKDESQKNERETISMRQLDEPVRQ